MVKSTENERNESRINRRRLGLDTALVSGLGLLLVAIHFILPESLKENLAFHYAEFNITGLYTSAFVQLTDLQLWGNLVAYILAVYLTYLLITEVNLQHWFRPTFIALIVFLPALVTLSSYSIFTFVYELTLPPERGFSGVASGFGGFLFIAYIEFLRNSINSTLANNLGITIFLLLLVEIHYIHSGGIDILVSILAILGIAMTIGLSLWQLELNLSELRLLKDHGRTVIWSLMTIAVLGALMMGMFPADFIEGGRFTNIIAHGMGFLWGCLLSVISLKWIQYGRYG